jgi:hypothetical protein
MQHELSDISENELEEPWDETWCPVALNSSKSVPMQRNFDTLHPAAPRAAFTGNGTVTPGHRQPATVAQKRKSLSTPSNPLPRRRSVKKD